MLPTEKLQSQGIPLTQELAESAGLKRPPYEVELIRDGSPATLAAQAGNGMNTLSMGSSTIKQYC